MNRKSFTARCAVSHKNIFFSLIIQDIKISSFQNLLKKSSSSNPLFLWLVQSRVTVSYLGTTSIFVASSSASFWTSALWCCSSCWPTGSSTTDTSTTASGWELLKRQWYRITVHQTERPVWMPGKGVFVGFLCSVSLEGAFSLFGGVSGISSKCKFVSWWWRTAFQYGPVMFLSLCGQI